MMTVLPVVAISAVVLLVAYVVYGRLLVRWLGVDDNRTTPAVEHEDGNDFVPADAPVVLGGHFTAIAAAGPVVGPILAAQYFGWLPALVWILLGSIFIGGIHDAGSLLASIRHNATSITQVVREHMSRGAYLTFLIFVWLSLIYVVVAFTDVTASSFAKFESIVVEGQSNPYPLNGGAVAIGATAYLVLSIVLGLLLKYTKTPWYIGLIGSVIILGATIWYAPGMANWLADHGLTFMNMQTFTGADIGKKWDMALLVYCFIASITPMWILLQPRGIIGATFLYAALAFGLIGALVGGWTTHGQLTIQYPAFKAFDSSVGYLFPMLFITIACGACSGFHSIVASGTTCKQIKKEKDIKPVAYGAMLLEAMVAVFSLTCVMIMLPDGKVSNPDSVYAKGMAIFQTQLHVPYQFALGFGLLAFSSFVFDTLDVCTRLGRYVFQELTGLEGMIGGAIATLCTLVFPALYLWYSEPGSFKTFWTIFGTSNQLLAALTLVGISVWLWRTGRPVWFALAPAIFMLVTTCTALTMNFITYWHKQVAPLTASKINIANMVIAVALMGLAIFVAFEAVRVYMQSRKSVPVIAD